MLLVQLVKRREMEEVKTLMAPPEDLNAALQRVRQQVLPLQSHFFEEMIKAVCTVNSGSSDRHDGT